jgi:FkbM family methyltransferase
MICKNLTSRLHTIWKKMHASLAYRYFEKIRPIHASHFPQMCCYSFDHISQEINFHGQFKKTELDCITTIFRRNMSGKTVLDIGANIGNHSLAFSHHCKQVFAFEPHPKTFRLLELNSMDVSNIHPINVGASDRTAKMKAADDHYNMGGARILDDSPVTGETDNQIEFSLIPLDSMEQLKNVEIGFIKIDVEGHELQAFKGAKGLLEKHRPVIAFEQLEDAFDSGTSDVIEFLKDVGYKHFYTAKRKQNWRFKSRIMKLLEAVFAGIPADNVELFETQHFKKGHYTMIIASSDSTG